MIIVREATQADVPWIVGQLKDFSAYLETKHLLFTDHETVGAQISGLIEQGHLVLIADKDGEQVGLIAGYVVPHFMNASIKTLLELFWWVPEKHRGTRAGLLLLKAFVAWGRANVNMISMNVQEKTMVKSRSLERYGFKPQELSYLLEVE